MSGVINISLTKDAMNSNFWLMFQGKVITELPSNYACATESDFGWKCKSCGVESKYEPGRRYKTKLIERCNAHWYCRCRRHEVRV